MSYCVSVVVVNPIDDPTVGGTPLFDRPPLTEEESTVWVHPPHRAPFEMWSPGRHRFIGPLMIQESLSHTGHACYVPGLHRYYPGDWQGRGYFLFADSGKRVPATTWVPSRAGAPIFDSEPLVITHWDLPDYPSDLWGQLAIRPPFVEPADIFLRAALAASRDRRIFVVCEYNGNVSDYRGGGPLRGDEDVQPNPETRRLGPITLRAFWDEHDRRRITIPSLICIEDADE